MQRKRIISYSIARQLIKKGFIVIDIEPNNQEENRTVFIFENTEALNTTYNNIQQRRKEKYNGENKNKLSDNTN